MKLLPSLILLVACNCVAQSDFTPTFVAILSQPPSGVSPPPPLPLAVITNFTSPSVRSGGGTAFTVGFNSDPATGIHITALGRWVFTGNSESHSIAVYDLSTSAVLYSTTINLSGVSPNQFFYTNVSPPLAVTGGHSIVIATSEGGANLDTWGDSTTLNSYSSDWADPQSCFFISGSPPFQIVSANSTYVPVNAEYTVP